MAYMGMHCRAARKTSGPVYRIEKTVKAMIARFNQRFGKMRMYKKRMLNLRSSSSSAQQMVVMYAAKKSVDIVD
jgi:hypothetical protein